MEFFKFHFSLNARFGTIAVPNILFFHNAKAVARFNSTIRTLDSMIHFISNITGKLHCCRLRLRSSPAT